MLDRAMEILLNDRRRRPMGRVRVDPAARPVLVKVTDAQGRTSDAYLEWEHALDDAGQLRACVACGCHKLYRRKTLPRVTPFVLVLAAAGVVAGALGYSSHPVVLSALVALLLVDIAVLIVARTQLVCYRCGSEYGQTRIARYHAPWDARVAAEPDAQADAQWEGAPGRPLAAGVDGVGAAGADGAATTRAGGVSAAGADGAAAARASGVPAAGAPAAGDADRPDASLPSDP